MQCDSMPHMLKPENRLQNYQGFSKMSILYWTQSKFSKQLQQTFLDKALVTVLTKTKEMYLKYFYSYYFVLNCECKKLPPRAYNYHKRAALKEHPTIYKTWIIYQTLPPFH